MGTNSRIFEAQTAAIRYTLGPQHTYEFVDGSVPTKMAPGMLIPILVHARGWGAALIRATAIEPFVSPSDEFLQYADDASSDSCLRALLDLEAYIEEDGPFDGVMAFSQGAGLAASLLIRQTQQDRQLAQRNPVFR